MCSGAYGAGLSLRANENSSGVLLRWTGADLKQGSVSVYRIVTKPTRTRSLRIATVSPSKNSFTDTQVVAKNTYQYYLVQRTSRSNDAILTLKRTPISNQVIQLPIEIFGEGNSKSVSFNLLNASLASTLRVRFYGLIDETSASVSINQGAEIPVTNSNWHSIGYGAQYGGIGGPANVLTVELPLTPGTLQNGTNSITFKFKKIVKSEMGFRILSFNITDSIGSFLIPPSQFTESNPDNATGLLMDSATIAAGKSLWNTAQLTFSPGTTLKMKATCADCHGDTGIDLKYFGFSNESIAKRSEFHGLTAQQGLQIASYIRSLNIPAKGRPWNPPFQPGPTLDVQNNWAAGAGIDAVLDTDIETAKYVFPNGVNAAAINVDGNLDLRHTPVSFQMPDWNRWLPTVHPKDFFGSTFDTSMMRVRWEGSSTGKDIKSQLNGPNATQYVQSKALFNDLNAWVSKDFFDFTKLPAVTAIPSDESKAFAIYSLVQWRAVKAFTILLEKNLLNLGKLDNPNGEETNIWPGAMFFYTSPFMAGLRGTNLGALSIDSPFATYLSNQWYYLQMIVNSGNKHRYGNSPVDWMYTLTQLAKMSAAYNIPQSMRLVLVMVEAMQQSNTFFGLDSNRGFNIGWTARLSNWVNPQFAGKGVYDNQTQVLRAQIGEALTRNWLDVVKRYTPDQYVAAGYADPRLIPNNDPVGDSADAAYGALVGLKKIGVNQALLTEYADWAKTVWPLASWDAIVSGAQPIYLNPIYTQKIATSTGTSFQVYPVKKPASIAIYQDSSLIGYAQYDSTLKLYVFNTPMSINPNSLYSVRVTAADGSVSGMML